MREAVITGGARTGVGRLLGSLSGFTAPELGGIAIKAALERAGITGDQVEYVIMGQVLQAGAGQVPARQAAVAGGIPMTVPATTINKACLSGLDATALAAQLLPGSGAGHKYGSIEMLDAMAGDGLTDAFDRLPMGELTDTHNARLGIGRREQDEFAARSHQRAAAAIRDGLLAAEVTAVSLPQRRGEPVIFDTDEGVRGEATVESMGGLRPAFAPEGTITAGSPSPISGGAGAGVAVSAGGAAA